MNPSVAIFYHCCLASDTDKINRAHALRIIDEQLSALVDQPLLLTSARKIYIGCTGDESNAAEVREMSGIHNVEVVSYGLDSVGEWPTLHALWSYAISNQDSRILYLHSKCTMHPEDPFCSSWRWCMMDCVVNRWELCLSALKSGFDLVGPHWYRSDVVPHAYCEFFGGNLWWAQAKWISGLSEPPRKSKTRREAEAFLTRRPEKPMVCDLAPHQIPSGCLERVKKLKKS